MRKMKVVLALAAILGLIVAWSTVEAAPPNDADWQFRNGGMFRLKPILFHDGDSVNTQNRDAYRDTTLLIQDEHDTTMWVEMGGADEIITYHKIHALNDTARVNIRAQVSMDTSLTGLYLATLATGFTAGFSAENVSDDTVMTKIWHTSVDTSSAFEADRMLVLANRYIRWIYKDSTNALDSVRVGKDWVQMKFPPDHVPRDDPKK